LGLGRAVADGLQPELPGVEVLEKRIANIPRMALRNTNLAEITVSLDNLTPSTRVPFQIVLAPRFTTPVGGEFIIRKSKGADLGEIDPKPTCGFAGRRDAERPGQSARELYLQAADHSPDVGIHLHAIFDQAAGMQHCPVVAPAKSLANRAQGTFRHLAREEHRDLTWKSDIRRRFAQLLRQFRSELLGRRYDRTCVSSGVSLRGG
jgi:hypothetical protein